ncbi:hypothetical protein OTU49_016711 [Cherax quadricarinatus]|uniref:Uncharacterized protein n=1 Tax=Cherax quadricarinatus TaxID=27406 RepID=A0AAW0Y5T1_CHEQU
MHECLLRKVYHNQKIIKKTFNKLLVKQTNADSLICTLHPTLEFFKYYMYLFENAQCRVKHCTNKGLCICLCFSPPTVNILPLFPPSTNVNFKSKQDKENLNRLLE